MSAAVVLAAVVLAAVVSTAVVPYRYRDVHMYQLASEICFHFCLISLLVSEEVCVVNSL